MGWFGKRKSSPPPPPRAHAPGDSGIVEELREELHHAVEHVPAPVRWTVGKLVRLGLLVLASLVLVGLVSTILYLANRTELVAHELALFLNTTLARRSDVQVDIADVRGNPFNSVRLMSPKVRFTDDRSAPTFLEAEWIDLSYEPLSLLPGREPRIRIHTSKPVVTIGRRADGTLRLPAWRSEEADRRKTRGQGRDLDVRLVVDDATVRLPHPLEAVAGMKLDVSARTGGGTLVTVNALTWKSGPYRTRHLDVIGSVWLADSLHLELKRARTDDVAFTAAGRWPSDGKGVGQLDVDVERVPWMWLADVTGNDSFRAKGVARGSIRAQLGQDLRGTFDVDADWDDLPVEARGAFSWAKGQLRFDPLIGHSPAGDLNGDLAWTKAGWQVGGQARAADPEHWGAIGLEGWPKGDLNGRFRYAVDTRREPSVARLDATLAGSEIEGWTIDGGVVTVRFPAVGPDSFTVDLQRRGGRFALAGAAHDGWWGGRYRLADFPLEEWPDGRKSGLSGVATAGEGTVVSRDGALEVDGTLEGRALAWLGATSDRWRLTRMHGPLLPKPDLTIDADTGPITWLGIAFDSLRAATRVGETSARLDSVVAFASDTLIRVDGEAAWRDARWGVTLDHALARSDRFEWTADPPVLLAGDANGVDFERLTAHDRDAHLELEGRWATAGGSYAWRARATDLDLTRVGLPPDLGLGGTASATLEVLGPYAQPRWTFTSTTERPTWGGHQGDRVVLALNGAPGELSITDGSFGLGGGTLRARGRFSGTARPWPKTLDQKDVQDWLASAARWDGEATASEFPIDQLGRMSSAAIGWTGRVGGRVTVGGRPGDPTFEVNLDGRPIAWRNLSVESVEAHARYANERLDVSELKVTRDGRASTARGDLPVRLALDRKPETLEKPMQWRLDVPNGDLGWIAALVPALGAADGDFSLGADVRGTPKAPDLAGTVRVQNGVVRMAGREETIENVRAVLRMSEDKLTVDSLSATQGTSGSVRGHGEVTIRGFKPDHYRFDLVLRDCAASEAGLYAVSFDGEVSVTDGPRLGSLWLPRVEGDLRVREAVILLDFANQSENDQLAATAAPLFWTYRVQVTATHRLFWRPPDGDVEFSANLNLEQTPRELIIYGDMRALRGTYYFLSNRYEVTEGELTFDNIGGVNPQITAEAVTEVTPLAGPGTSLAVSAGSGGEAEATHRVSVRIEGRAKEPLISFASTPNDWDEPRILRELTQVGRLTTNTAAALGDPFDHYLTRAINRTLSTEMARAFSGYINEWALDREHGGLFGGEGELILGVGTRVTPNLQVRYRQRVPGLSRSPRAATTSVDPLERDLEAEYRLSRFFYVTSELVQRRSLSTSSGTTRPEFNVNLKARWEY